MGNTGLAGIRFVFPLWCGKCRYFISGRDYAYYRVVSRRRTVHGSGANVHGIVFGWGGIDSNIRLLAQHHWRLETMPLLGLLLVFLVVPLCFLVRQPPGNAVSPSARTMDNDAALLTSAVNSRFFVFMALAYVLTMAAQVGGIAHLYSRVEQITDYQTAAFAVQVLSICSISGRFFGGWLVSRIPIRWFALGNLSYRYLV